ncbi:MAG: hypothetical protein ACE5ES_04400 [Candidatus Nanoarchaeia archaeon]
MVSPSEVRDLAERMSLDNEERIIAEIVRNLPREEVLAYSAVRPKDLAHYNAHNAKWLFDEEQFILGRGSHSLREVTDIELINDANEHNNLPVHRVVYTHRYQDKVVLPNNPEFRNMYAKHQWLIANRFEELGFG